MSINVGIDLSRGRISYYDEVQRRSILFYVDKIREDEAAKIPLMFEQIVSKINGKCGCACAYIRPYYGRKICKKVLEEGIQAGFKNIEIIDEDTAFYLNAMSQIYYKPSRGNVIWIFNENYINIWQKISQKAKFLEKCFTEIRNLNEFMNILKLRKVPDILLSRDKVDANYLEKISTCQFFVYKNIYNFESTGSLIKARVTAGDSFVEHLDVENNLSPENKLEFVKNETTFSTTSIDTETLQTLQQSNVSSNSLYHVGILPYYGTMAYYNVTEKSITELQIMETFMADIDEVSSMYEEIATKINGELGYICVCLHHGYDNEIRKAFIEEGLKWGFKNVEIINYNTAIYLNAMSQNNYKPSNGNVIWIAWVGSCFHIWKINDEKAEFVGEWYGDSDMTSLDNIMRNSKLNKGPDVVLHEHYIQKSNFDKLSRCQFFEFTNGTYSLCNGSLIKARITASDVEIAYFDALNFINEKIVLKIGEKEIISFQVGQNLPLTYSLKIIKKPNCDDMEIISDRCNKELIKLPNWQEIYLTFQVDTNQIYSVNFTEYLNLFPQRNGTTYYGTNVVPNKMEKRSLRSLQFSDSSTTTNYTFPKISDQFVSERGIIGIDLGTTRCCAAVNRKNGITAVALDNTGERLLPSYVAYDEEKVKCGKIVIDLFWPFEISDIEEKVYLGIQKSKKREHILPEEVAAELLKFVRQKAEDFQGTKLPYAVVTVPAAFTKSQKDATIKAANLAGWNEIVLLPEPVAAAFAYFIDRPIPNNSNILLFDFGGGTLDVCVFKIENDQIKVVSNTGDTKLGGRDFDTVLFNYFKNALASRYGISLAKNKKYLLMLLCQEAKENLSLSESYSLCIDDFDPNQEGMIEITQTEFQKMTELLLNKVKNTVHSALFDSKCEPNKIHLVLQVGGGSRMPMIKKLLQDIFPQANHICEEHPDEVVAYGAAYYACSIFSAK